MQEEINLREEHLIVGRILAKYPQTTDEEQQVLDNWKQKNGNRQLFDSIMESRPTDLQRIVAIITDMERVRQKYLALMPDEGSVKTHWWNNWKMYAAAAAVTAALITTSLWLNNKKQATVAVQKPLPVSHDAAPGTCKAKLILADGSVVLLDSAGNNTLAPQGGVNVTSAHGKLIYTPSNNKSGLLYNTLTTAKGEMYALLLADGSKCWLNSQSSVHYPVNAAVNQEPAITTTGEVFFEIKHNPQRKFKISVNGLNIDDIGTQFNVNAYADEDHIVLTLIEGSVRATKGNQFAQVKKGEEAITSQSPADHMLIVKAGADLEKAIAWKNGQFRFNKDDLRTVMRQLARWYDLDVVYEGNVPNGQFVGTVPRELKLSQVLEILASSDVHFNVEGKKLIVKP